MFTLLKLIFRFFAKMFRLIFYIEFYLLVAAAITLIICAIFCVKDVTAIGLITIMIFITSASVITWIKGKKKS